MAEHVAGGLDIAGGQAVGESGFGFLHHSAQAAEQFPALVGEGNPGGAPVLGDRGPDDEAGLLELVNAFDDRWPDHVQGSGEVFLDDRSPGVECGQDGPAGKGSTGLGKHGVKHAADGASRDVELPAKRVETRLRTVISHVRRFGRRVRAVRG